MTGACIYLNMTKKTYRKQEKIFAIWLKETRDDRFVSFQHILVLPGIVWS